MGLLWSAVKWKLGGIGRLFGTSRLQLKFYKDNSVEIKAYKPNKEKAVSWSSQTGETKTHIRRNWHYMKSNGAPVDVVVEGKSENLNIIDENRSTQEDSDTAGLCLSYMQLGEQIERRKHKGFSKETLLMVMIVVALAASVFSMFSVYTFTTQTIPEIVGSLDAKIAEVNALAVSNVQAIENPGGSGSTSGIVLPSGSG